MKFLCTIQLPINSPLKEVVIGPPMISRDLAIRASALRVCLKLQKIRELDEYMLPIGKDNSSGSHYHAKENKVIQPRNPAVKTSALSTNQKPTPTSTNNNNGMTESVREARPGTTKRRQYYYKQVASCLRTDNLAETKEDKIEIANTGQDKCGNQAELTKAVESQKDTMLEEEGAAADDSNSYHLYSLHLKLTCAIPEDQNTRGRKINDPQDSDQKFGILVKDDMPPVSQFPIYTRSGEVFVTTKLLDDCVNLNEETKKMVLKFHDYTFSKVLRLVKYPMNFSPDNAENSIIVLPLKLTKSAKDEQPSKEEIDWEFLKKIGEEGDTKLAPVSDEERKDFEFSKSRYEDAVIMPWYRNQDQPQYFYVAEICSHLSPASDFPGQGFESFEKYYLEKYKIQIQNLKQPLLDVDHTSARLNFLTPRYVNRKGVALPTSSEETKKSKRENLDQKQILVPEMCSIHPFPASLWRQTVCLPCILYRLNGLLVANQLRSLVAVDTKMCKPKLLKNHEWPPLTFGWTLSDVLMHRNTNPNITNGNTKTLQNGIKDNSSNKRLSNPNKSNIKQHNINEAGEGKIEDELGCLTNQLLSKLNEEDSKLKSKSSLDIGMWSNDMVNNAKLSEQQNSFNEEDEEMDEFEEMERLFGGSDVALPDNLTILDTSILPLRSTGGTDWGTGIAQRPFRVGSPTFFSNPNINIPGVMDDYDRFSCSDVSEMDNMDDFDEIAQKSHSAYGDEVGPKEGEDVGSLRIEFLGDNTAEAVDNENVKKKRSETLAKDLEEESEMVLNIPWQLGETGKDVCLENVNEQATAAEKLLLSESNFILESSEMFCKDRVKQSDIHNSYDETNSLTNLVNEIKELEDQDSDVVKLVTTFETQLSVIPRDYHENIIKDKHSPAAKDGIIPWESDDKFNFSFDLQPDLSKHTGPSPSLILQSLTMSNSNDAINLERLVIEPFQTIIVHN